MESFWKFWEYLFLWIESFEGQENFDLINFSPKEKRVKKDSWTKGHLVDISVKINRNAGHDVTFSYIRT